MHLLVHKHAHEILQPLNGVLVSMCIQEPPIGYIGSNHRVTYESWQWHRTGSSWFPVRTLPVAPLWCDLGFVPNSRGNKAAANLRPSCVFSQVGLNPKI